MNRELLTKRKPSSAPKDSGSGQGSALALEMKTPLIHAISDMPWPAAILDRNLCILNLSQGWRLHLPIEISEWKGRSLVEVFSFQFSGWSSACEDCLRGLSYRGQEEKFRDSQGNDRVLHWEIHPWWTPDGHVGGPILYINETTNRVRLEKELSEARASKVMAAQLSAVGEMAASVAHEINNPLAILQGKATILQKLARENRITEEKVLQESEKMIRASQRISRILQSLKFVARNGERDPLISCHIPSVLAEVLELASERFRSNNVQLKISVNPEHRVYCRQVQLGQVLLNLLNNAFDAVFGFEKAWVDVQSFSVGEKIYISVTDSGNGLIPEVANKIMQPFFTTKELGQGTGLGLSISRAIVEAHDGRLFLDDSGPHTRFVIELPQGNGNEQVLLAG